jgi:repressor LexA
MSDLTTRQTEIMDYIKHYLHTEGMPPTRLEICEAFGFKSPNAVQDHLAALVRKNQIRVLPNRARGIQIAGQR